MSQKDVENARRSYATLNKAYQAGDPSLFQPILETYWDPDAVFEPAGVLPDSTQRPHRGWDAVLQFIGGQMKAFSEGWLEASEVHRPWRLSDRSLPVRRTRPAHGTPG